MLANHQMKAGRFLRWHKARQTMRWIEARWAEGRTVYITTYARSTAIKAKNAECLQAGRDGVYMRRGKHWDCINGCQITAR